MGLTEFHPEQFQTILGFQFPLMSTEARWGAARRRVVLQAELEGLRNLVHLDQSEITEQVDRIVGIRMRKRIRKSYVADLGLKLIQKEAQSFHSPTRQNLEELEQMKSQFQAFHIPPHKVHKVHLKTETIKISGMYSRARETNARIVEVERQLNDLQ